MQGLSKCGTGIVQYIYTSVHTVEVGTTGTVQYCRYITFVVIYPR